MVALGAPALGVDPSTTAGLIGEISSTLYSDVHQLEHGRPSSELIDLDAVLLEGELRGHPWIVASKGRVGFSADDLARICHAHPTLSEAIHDAAMAVDKRAIHKAN